MMAEQASIYFSSEPFSTRIHVSLRMREEYQSASEQTSY